MYLQSCGIQLTRRCQLQSSWALFWGKVCLILHGLVLETWLGQLQIHIQKNWWWVGCAPPERGHPLCNLKTQHLYYIHSKEETYMLVVMGDPCKGTISGCSHPGGGSFGCQLLCIPFSPLYTLVLDQRKALPYFWALPKESVALSVGLRQ